MQFNFKLVNYILSISFKRIKKNASVSTARTSFNFLDLLWITARQAGTGSARLSRVLTGRRLGWFSLLRAKIAPVWLTLPDNCRWLDYHEAILQHLIKSIKVSARPKSVPHLHALIWRVYFEIWANNRKAIYLINQQMRFSGKFRADAEIGFVYIKKKME